LETPSPSIGQARLLLDHIGEHEAAAAVVTAIEKSIRDGVVTNDMGRTAGTAKVGSYITESVRRWKVGILGKLIHSFLFSLILVLAVYVKDSQRELYII
jgi:hypothetical protein